MKKLSHFRKLIAFLGFSPLLLQADMTTFFNSIEQQLTSPTHSKQKTSLILNVNDTDCPQPNSNNTSLD